ncbi:hypothetical protein [Nocardia sp. NPDC020380]|uniref:hypothetical protein n=1 Tax=Nocardia sp. NPDC020380 TaxID=3364309 RepID=UPI0037B24BA2
MRAEWELRRRCRRVLNDLEIRPPLDIVDLCRRMGERRGKPIELVPFPIPVPGPFGAWIATSTTDYILYQRETTRIHQNHIVVHEIGHIVAGHHSDEQDDTLMRELSRTSSLPPDVVRRALRRTCYDTAEEREAETVATIILEWASVLDGLAAGTSKDGAAERMGAALTDRLGWL